MEELLFLFWLVCWHVQVVVDRRHIYMLLQISEVTMEDLLWRGKEKKKRRNCTSWRGDFRLTYLFIWVFLNVCINMEQPSYNGWSLSENVFVFSTDVLDLDQIPALMRQRSFHLCSKWAHDSVVGLIHRASCRYDTTVPLRGDALWK